MKKYFFTLFTLLCSTAFSQEPWLRIYDHNIDLPGAEYKYSFVHMSDVHIGEGDPEGDYGTFGFLDTMHAGDLGDPAVRLRSAVNWINANHVARGIKFVIISGDLTDSGEKSEFYKFKEIFGTLETPYVPLIGNHDVWPYIKGDSAREAPYPYGDSILNEIFEPVFDSLQMFFDGWDNGTRLTRGFNAEGNTSAYLQNFVATYEGTHFIFMDFDPRYHAIFPPGPGIGPEAQLHDYAGGTLQWLQQTLENLPDKGEKNIFLVSHHPAAKDIWAFVNAFSADELARIVEVLFPFRQHLGLWFAGHIHRNDQYILTTIGQQAILTCLEVESNKEQPYGAMRIINVYGTDVSTGIVDQVVESTLSIYPNPASRAVRLTYPATLRGEAVIAIYALDGRKISEEKKILDSNTLELLLNDIAPGSYIIKLNHNEVEYTASLIVD